MDDLRLTSAGPLLEAGSLKTKILLSTLSNRTMIAHVKNALRCYLVEMIVVASMRQDAYASERQKFLYDFWVLPAGAWSRRLTQD